MSRDGRRRACTREGEEGGGEGRRQVHPCGAWGMWPAWGWGAQPPALSGPLVGSFVGPFGLGWSGPLVCSIGWRLASGRLFVNYERGQLFGRALRADAAAVSHRLVSLRDTSPQGIARGTASLRKGQ